MRPDELAAVVLHQANLRIIEPVAARIGAVNAIVARDVVESGNTSAASVPLALSKLLEEGRVAAGAPMLLFGFGGQPVVRGDGRPLPLSLCCRPLAAHAGGRPRRALDDAQVGAPAGELDGEGQSGRP
ncbi:3-oxoacyl-[acyl-carrier-protein] synthase III C-terminal domain-containing protein [Nonomuraea salmonea]|uniref:3-oxoacyl-[acyl-carrier-protein] synthase III C-terminal domain-containing protein n=1 Tax=Nonomuraea salmonea TaxID=46181 RepID=UPI002FECC0EC